MAYITATQLESLISAAQMAELTADTGSVVDAVVLAEVCSDASEEADGLLFPRNAVPVTNAKALTIVKIHVKRLAKAILFSRRGLLERYDTVSSDASESRKFLSKCTLPSTTVPASTVIDTLSDGQVGSEAVVFYSPEVDGDVYIDDVES